MKTTCDEPFAFIQKELDAELEPVKEGPHDPKAKQHNLDRSSMGNPLKDQPEVETIDEDDEDLAPHLQNKPKKGESTADNPFDFTFEKLCTDNPTESGLASSRGND